MKDLYKHLFVATDFLGNYFVALKIKKKKLKKIEKITTSQMHKKTSKKFASRMFLMHLSFSLTYIKFVVF